MSPRFYKIPVFIVSLLPLSWGILLIATNRLGPDPGSELALYTGEWALRFLLVVLALVPVASLLNLPWLKRLSRMLGLFCFFYASLHLLIYLALLLGWEWRSVVDDLAERPYIVVGALAYLILLPMAITSTQGWQRRLKRRWKRLHRGVYIALLLVLLHLLWVSKASLAESFIYSLIGFLLLAWRLKPLLQRNRTVIN